MPVLEKLWEARLRRWAIAHDWECQKVKFAEKGWMDRLFIHKRIRNLMVWMELKREGKEPYDLQYKRLTFLADMGYLVTWTDNFDDAVMYLERAAAAAVDPSAVPSGGPKETPVAGVLGAISRPRTRKDKSSSSGHKSVESEGSNF